MEESEERLDLRTLVSAEIIQLLRSGHVPSSSEYSYINELSVEAETERRKHIQTMNRLIERIAFLEHQEEVYASIILSPIRKLPTEILSAILAFAVSPSDNSFSVRAGGKNGYKSRAVELGLVCAHWRSVSLLTPQIWANLRIEVYVDDPSLNAPVQMHLERAQSVPLQLDIFVRGPYQDHQLICTSLLQLLLLRLGQWGIVKFVAPAPLCPKSFDSFMQCKEMPMLHDLELVGCTEARNPQSHHLNVKFFKHAHNLKKLRMSACYIDDDFPWTQLHGLGVGTSEGSNTALKALRMCGQGLQRASFHLPGSPIGNYTSFHSSALQRTESPNSYQLYPVLEYIGIMVHARQISPNDNRCGFEAVTDLFRTITCPHLSNLRLVSNVTRKVWIDEHHTGEAEGDEERKKRRHAFWPQKDLFDFFRRSQCSLTSLHLRGLWISESELLELLRVPEVGRCLRELVVHEIEDPAVLGGLLSPRLMEE
ncbi:hypothetical protein V5O48_012770, partial [Marasmius crinis-equi]